MKIKLISLLFFTILFHFCYSQSNSAQTSFTIGQAYGGGIIFYIDGTGQHGLIAAPSDQSNGIVWWNKSNGSTPTTKGTTSTYIGTGFTNTSTIINLEPNDLSAATLCLGVSLGGYSDWYLPSKDELFQLYTQRNIVGGFATSGNTSYWTSSDYGNVSSAWTQDFLTGTQSGHDEFRSNVSVRVIRSF